MKVLLQSFITTVVCAIYVKPCYKLLLRLLLLFGCIVLGQLLWEEVVAPLRNLVVLEPKTGREEGGKAPTQAYRALKVRILFPLALPVKLGCMSHRRA